MSHSSGESGNTNTVDTRTDPAMKALYHMSRTAGAGMGDYAAVNVLAVIGLIVGMSCFLLLIFGDSYFMLALPLGAIITCAVAISQIRGSNGTQVGMWLAVAGMLLSVGFGAVTVGSHLTQASSESADRAKINQLIEKLASSATTQSTIPASYDLFHPRFKESVSAESYARTLAIYTGLTSRLPVASIRLGETVIFDDNQEAKISQATALIVVQSKERDAKGNPVKWETPAIFRRDLTGEWKIYSIPDWFKGQEPDGKDAPAKAKGQ